LVKAVTELKKGSRILFIFGFKSSHKSIARNALTWDIETPTVL